MPDSRQKRQPAEYNAEEVDISIFARGAKSWRETQAITIEGEILEPETALIDSDPADIYAEGFASDDSASETMHSGSSAGLSSTYRGSESNNRALAVRHAMEVALDEWWSHGEYLSQALLRNGLLVLEAGHDLDEPHRSLLLRTSLQLRRGMVTALRHQTDADRTAYIIKEAILDEPTALPLSLLWTLKQEDEESAEWVFLLLDDLQQDAFTLKGPKQRLAQDAIRQLTADQPLGLEEPRRRRLITSSIRPPIWSMGRLLLIVLSCIAIFGVYFWQQRRSDFSEMSLIPAGSYAIGNSVEGETENRKTVEAFAIDRSEVTNRSYQLCYEQGGCLAPAQIESQTRLNYFVDSAFATYPVVHINWTQAHQYCLWAGKRLPTADEWEIAAAIAPATGRRYLYPWGDLFRAQFVNSAPADDVDITSADTTAVGTYHPGGTSSFGAVDMAGNVAEWTATEMGLIHQDASGEVMTYAAKGGSYLDPPEMLRTNVRQSYAQTAAEPWLGFRCAATQPKEEIAAR